MEIHVEARTSPRHRSKFVSNYIKNVTVNQLLLNGTGNRAIAVSNWKAFCSIKIGPYIRVADTCPRL
jgi:hypothetical protein